MDHVGGIDAGLTASAPFNEIARKIFLTYPTSAFVGHEEEQYAILNEVACHFDVPISSIHVCGSAKVGQSFHKKTAFAAGVSDLDLAIVDGRLFASCVAHGMASSKGYSDLTKFPLKNGRSTYEDYVSYLGRGIFRPDLMPTGPRRSEWRGFFSKLSDKYTSMFCAITGAVYLSEACFEQKQRSAIKAYKDGKAI